MKKIIAISGIFLCFLISVNAQYGNTSAYPNGQNNNPTSPAGMDTEGRIVFSRNGGGVGNHSYCFYRRLVGNESGNSRDSGTNYIEIDCPCPNDLRVQVFQDSDYGGESSIIEIGEYRSMDNLNFSNDEISSLKVSKSVKLTVFEDNDFGGKSKTFIYGDIGWIGSEWNDRISSIKIEFCEPAVTFFYDQNFKGQSFSFTRDKYTPGFDVTEVKSLRISEGIELAAVTQNDPYAQPDTTIKTGDYANLKDYLNGKQIYYFSTILKKSNN